MVNGFFAVLIGMLGVGALFFSWRSNDVRKYLVRLLGWGLLIASLYFWITAIGPEFGVVVGLLVPAFFAWIYGLFASPQAKATSKTRRQQRLTVHPKLLRILKNCGKFMLLIPGFAVLSTVSAVAIVYLLPMQEVNRLAICVFLMPTLWAVSIAWQTIDRLYFRPLIINLVVSFISTLYIFF